jgi:hypothetical protein
MENVKPDLIHFTETFCDSLSTFTESLMLVNKWVDEIHISL